MARKSPVRIECEWLLPRAEAIEDVRKHGTTLPSKKFATLEAKARQEFRICKWRCRGPLRAVRFVHRKHPNDQVIIHRSTKYGKGSWQMSKFDEGGPYGDREGSSCDALTQDLHPRNWRLADVRR